MNDIHIHVQSYTGVYTVHMHTYMWYIHVCTLLPDACFQFPILLYFILKLIPKSPSTGVTYLYIEYKLVVPTCTGSSSLQYLYPVPVICNTCTSNGAVQEGNVCFLLGE